MFPLGLSMLWESTDPQVALYDRFGFDSFAEAAGWLSDVLADQWAIKVQACDRIVISDANVISWVRTDHGALVAKWSCAQEKFGQLADTAELLTWLHEQGRPVLRPLTAVDGSHRVVVNGLSVTLQPLMEADLLDTTDQTAVHHAGARLAELHGSLRARPGSGSPIDLHEQIERWLKLEDPGQAPEASRLLRELLTEVPPLDASPQLIHRDYRASNILTAHSDVVAILDFDDVAWDYCVQDLANASTVLRTRFLNWQPTPADVRRTLLAGYESVQPLTALERQWLRILILWIGIQRIPAGDDPAGWREAATW